jgi:hypothetical protein
VREAHPVSGAAAADHLARRAHGVLYVAAEGARSHLQAKFPVTPVFTQIEVKDGRVWMKPSGAGWSG